MSRDVLLNKCIQPIFLDSIKSIKLSLPLRTLFLSGCSVEHQDKLIQYTYIDPCAIMRIMIELKAFMENY
jgi:hypothetical protein